MNEVLSEILRTGYTRTVDGAETVQVNSAIFESEGLYLQKLVRGVRPLHSIEIGLAYGVSSLFICDALEVREGSQHIIIDPYQRSANPDEGGWRGIGIANLLKAGYGDIIELIEEPSYRALPVLERAGKRFDFAFIDGWHTFDFTLVDFFYIDRMLDIGGIVAFDNSDWPAVRKVCRFVCTNLSYEVVPAAGLDWKPPGRRRALDFVLGRVPFGSIPLSRRILRPDVVSPDISLDLFGPCIAFKKTADDSRRWDHFVDF